MLSDYYNDYLTQLVKKFIPPKASVIQFGHNHNSVFKNDKKFDYIVLINKLSTETDIQSFIFKLKKISHSETRIIVLYFNFMWKPILDLAEVLSLKKREELEPNWLSESNIENFFYLEQMEKIKTVKFFLMPVYFPIISSLINRFISKLPIFNELCLMNMSIFRPITTKRDCSVSIIIPARNEAGHMKGVLRQIPQLGTKTEVIFIEGNSTDNTYGVIRSEIKKYKGFFECRLYKQLGKGKGDAVRLGFSKAKNDLFMILDADLTVAPYELKKFYDAYIHNQGDLIIGSRLIYPMEKLAMRMLNIFGNKVFSMAFSFLLDQEVKDTLCGTKVLSKSSYERIVENRSYFGDFDPFGDYDLIFGAVRQNMKILEIPIRYKQRTYGVTNISRFTHGWLLLKMVLFAAFKLKFV